MNSACPDTYILGISGSPRKGNTEILVKKSLEVCEREGFKTDFVSLAEKKISYFGDKNEGDDTHEILEKMANAKAIIIGSPTYFANVPGKLKSLFDQSIVLRRDGFKLKNKIGGAIAVGGSRNGGQEQVILAIHNFMLIHEMIIVSDKETAHFGGIAVGRTTDDILRDDVGIRTVENLGKKVAETLKIFQK